MKGNEFSRVATGESAGDEVKWVVVGLLLFGCGLRSGFAVKLKGREGEGLGGRKLGRETLETGRGSALQFFTALTAVTRCTSAALRQLCKL